MIAHPSLTVWLAFALAIRLPALEQFIVLGRSQRARRVAIAGLAVALHFGQRIAPIAGGAAFTIPAGCVENASE